MKNGITHYQTSFRIQDLDGNLIKRLKNIVYGWVLKKEQDNILRSNKRDFLFRCDWPNLFQTRSSIVTNSFLHNNEEAWAIRFTEIDRQLSRKRFWYSEIGLKKDYLAVIVSVRISFAWNSEDLSHENEPPQPTVPNVVKYILRENAVYSGRPEFRLIEQPIRFSEVGMGQTLANLITSSERRYPLLVVNGDSQQEVFEAEALAKELTGKCQVAILSINVDLAEEFSFCIPKEYRIPIGFLRVFFPFSHSRNTSDRHRWYDIQSPEYQGQRRGIVNGLLRNHSLLEQGAVESIFDINRLIGQENLKRLQVSNPEQQAELEEFFTLYQELEKERDQFKQEAATYASEVDQHEHEVKRLNWLCMDYQRRLNAIEEDNEGSPSLPLLPTLPKNLFDVAQTAPRFFQNIIITNDALKSAKEYMECKCFSEAWEMLGHLNAVVYRLKFNESGQSDWEQTFKNETGYDLAMSEGRNTKRDKKLMKLRKIQYKNREYDITPHLKFGNQKPRMLRIHFAFDEATKKILVGYVGPHIPNATTKTI